MNKEENNFSKNQAKSIAIKVVCVYTLAVIVYFLFFRTPQRKYESIDRFYNNAIPCPVNGVCLSGKLFCKPGFKQISGRCVQDEERSKQIGQLANNMALSIAKNISDDCVNSYPQTEAELRASFNHKYFDEAIRVLKKYDENDFYVQSYDIVYTDSGFIAENAIPNLYCKGKQLYEKNKTTIMLYLLIVFLLIVLWLSIIYQNHKKNKIRKAAMDIINSMGHERRFENTYHPITDYQPLKTDPMSKYWPSIVREVEKNPSIYAVETTHGRKWRLIPPKF